MKISDLIQVGNPESTYLGLKILKESSDFGKFLVFAQTNLSDYEYKIMESLFDKLRPDIINDYTISCRIPPETQFRWHSVGIETIHNMIKFYENVRSNIK